MNLSRRSFLGGVLSLAATPVLTKVIDLSILPVIRGDGIHDDWAGLQALFDGDSFIVENNGLIAENGLLHRGFFKLSRELTIGRRPGFTLMANSFSTLPGFQGRSVLHITKDSAVTLLSTHIEGKGADYGIYVDKFSDANLFQTYVEGSPRWQPNAISAKTEVGTLYSTATELSVTPYAVLNAEEITTEKNQRS